MLNEELYISFTSNHFRHVWNNIIVYFPNFTNLFPTLGLFFAYVVSFYLVTFALKTIPAAIFYATWAGLGVFLIAVLGKILFAQLLTWQIILDL